MGLPKLGKRISNGSKVENWLGGTSEEGKVVDLRGEEEERGEREGLGVGSGNRGVGVKRFSISEKLGRGEVREILFYSVLGVSRGDWNIVVANSCVRGNLGRCLEVVINKGRELQILKEEIGSRDLQRNTAA